VLLLVLLLVLVLETPESIQVDHLLRAAVPPIFGPFVNETSIILFEYEYEKNQWYESPATIMPDGPFFFKTSSIGNLKFLTLRQ
jgi:hypothetical protein